MLFACVAKHVGSVRLISLLLLLIFEVLLTPKENPFILQRSLRHNMFIPGSGHLWAVSHINN